MRKETMYDSKSGQIVTVGKMIEMIKSGDRKKEDIKWHDDVDDFNVSDEAKKALKAALKKASEGEPEDDDDKKLDRRLALIEKKLGIAVEEEEVEQLKKERDDANQKNALLIAILKLTMGEDKLVQAGILPAPQNSTATTAEQILAILNGTASPSTVTTIATPVRSNGTIMPAVDIDLGDSGKNLRLYLVKKSRPTEFISKEKAADQIAAGLAEAKDFELHYANKDKVTGKLSVGAAYKGTQVNLASLFN